MRALHGRYASLLMVGELGFEPRVRERDGVTDRRPFLQNVSPASGTDERTPTSNDLAIDPRSERGACNQILLRPHGARPRIRTEMPELLRLGGLPIAFRRAWLPVLDSNQVIAVNSRALYPLR